MSSLGSLQQLAARNGLNLFGLVDAARFDRALPPEQRSVSVMRGCGTILVLGTAGRSLDFALQRHAGAAPPARDARATERLVEGSVGVVADALRAQQVCFQRVGPRDGRLPLVMLGEAAGFGVVSPVSGMLLHPDYGPWLRVRAALLLEGAPFGAPAAIDQGAGFQPCVTCSQPCVPACPPRALDGAGGSDRLRCAEHRSGGGCTAGCYSRMACPVGAEHADRPEAPVHAHSAEQAALQRRFGLGWWRFVPRALRGGARLQ